MDLHEIVASCQRALEQGIDGDLKGVRARLVECQISVQAALEACTAILRLEEQARVERAKATAARAAAAPSHSVGLPPLAGS